MNDALNRAVEHVSDCMGDIMRVFKKDSGGKITVIVRFPRGEEDFMLTSDTIAEIRKLLDRREAADQQ